MYEYRDGLMDVGYGLYMQRQVFNPERKYHN